VTSRKAVIVLPAIAVIGASRMAGAVVGRDRGGADPERRVAVDRPQHRGQDDRDAEQHDAIDGDADLVGDVPAVARQPGPHRRDLAGIANPDDALEEDEHAEGRDDPDQRGGLAQPTHDAHMDDHADQPGRDQRQQGGDDPRHAALSELPLEVRRADADGAMREVEDTRSSIDQD
jgi:hypothetical protein